MDLGNGKTDVVILGAGPAGLAAAYKLVEKNKSVVILEKDRQVGGMSKTNSFKGYLFDQGPHRFFTKSEKVMRFWQKILGNDLRKVSRLTRIYYKKKFFYYPLKPMNALFKLGILNSSIVMLSYLKSKVFPYKEEKTFEQWVSNRFGKKLYRTFFKAYTEKLWGIPCSKIQAEWVAQRIKGLSLRTAIKNAFFPDKSGKIKTLVEEFYYPKYGAGSMYERMAEIVAKGGKGKIALRNDVLELTHGNGLIKGVKTRGENGNVKNWEGDNFISSIPITLLVRKLLPRAPRKILEAVRNLKYRSTIFVNLVLDCASPFPDNWIYVHEPATRMLRLTNIINFSPDLLKDKNKTGLVLEYVCGENSKFWNLDDKKLLRLGLTDLEKIGLGKKEDFVDGFITRSAKTYPVYDAEYPRNLRIIKDYLGQFKNLQLIGRYGMFKYNNMDHSALTGFYAAENVLGKKHNIWEVNTDEEYHEMKK
jgi:protoporphyrinogen oxidase